MSHQASFDAFEEERELRDEEPDPWEFDEYGPTMDEPAHWIAPQEFETLPGTDVDARQLSGTGLSVEDFELVNQWDSGPERFQKVATGEPPEIHPDDRHRPERVDEWRETVASIESEDSPESGESGQAVATDGGQVVEETNERGHYEPGDTVLVIEDVAVGLMTSPNILEAEVSNSGKSVMIPEDADSINGSRRLDAETVFSGESEYRDSTGYQLYTPGRFRSKQRSNHAPGPQAGASSVTDPDELPEPTHWPEGGEPDDHPDECPECGADGPWYDVGKPRCEHCGETVDPDAEPKDEEAGEMPEKWDLSHLEPGDTLIIEGHSGEFVVTRVHYFRGTHTVNRLEAAKREGGEWREYTIQKVMGDQLKVNREGGPSVVINVDDPDLAQDFEKTGHDEDKRRRFIRDKRGR